MFRGRLNRFLRRYEGAGPVIRMKAKFFFLASLLVLAVIPVAIIYSAITQLHNPVLGNRLNPMVLVPEALALLPLALILALLLRGRFSLSAHLLLGVSFLTVWVVMFLDRSGMLEGMDSIVFVLGLLTITPLATVRRKSAILAYGAVNLAMLAAFSLHAKTRFHLTPNTFFEYLADNAVAIIFITLTAFTVFLINQRALEQLEDELAERRRQESEKERLQAQLLHAQKMESVGRLAGGVAHDFNNLLTTIIGNAGLALAKLDAASPETARLKDIIRAAESAAGLTRQLLAFSRRQEIEPRPFDLNRLIEGAVQLLERLIGEKIRTVLNLGADVVPIVADPGQVEQILINLALNARDAMPDGGTLVIGTRRARVDSPPPAASPVMRPGDYVVLSVGDTGSGIPAGDLQRIFDPFFTTKAVGQGTGLGLSSVYGAVQQNGGSIEVRSAPGRGTIMTVYFPASGLAPRAAETAAPPEELPGGREALLLVEDDELVLEFIQMILSSLGYGIRTAADGAAALALAAAPESRYDLLLTDVILPDMTGTTLASQARRRLGGLKVLYMSGHAESVVAHDGSVDERIHFIAKPFTALELARKVRQVLDSSQ